MKRIAILSASVRTGRLSHRVALYLENYFRQNALADTELLDLKAYDFPLFHERLAMQERPSDMLIDFTNRFNDADGLIIVSPVYNASYPAALKNVIDLYYKEWKHKPVGIVSVTSGKYPALPPYNNCRYCCSNSVRWWLRTLRPSSMPDRNSTSRANPARQNRHPP